MGKVKAHRNRIVFVLGIKYQFPMGKVKLNERVFYSQKTVKYQFPMGKVKKIKERTLLS